MTDSPHIRQLPWWHTGLPKRSGVVPRAPEPSEKPILSVGTLVRLRGKPQRLRRIIEVQWHSIRWVYVYVVETSTSDRKRGFTPYWFLPQLAVEHLNTDEQMR